jgi:hypothetical protein
LSLLAFFDPRILLIKEDGCSQFKIKERLSSRDTSFALGAAGIFPTPDGRLSQSKRKEAIMAYRTLVVLASVVTLSASVAVTEAQERSQQRSQTQEQIYGKQLMTEQERAEYRDRMRGAKTAEEREQIRKEHHERMKERAKERGVTIPDEPPTGRGGGMGPGGGGMGPGGGGMGPGGGRNR